MNTLTGTYLGLQLREKALPALKPFSSASSGWFPIRESFTGAWQQNVEVSASTALAYFAVYACTTLIAGDIAKLCLRLVEQDSDGIWNEVENPAYSPVLRKPNRYQNIVKFFEQWMVSKLTRGNTYVLKQRDKRGVVVALYVLDPSRVTPLVAPDGGVYYEVRRDDLSQVREERIVIPASEIIHDIMCALYHPLVGVSPIYASGVATTQGLAIQHASTQFFGNGSNPGGVLTAPADIPQATADRLKAYWDTNFSGDNVGKVAVLGNGLKYEPMHVNAVDSQLIEQLKWTADTVCSTYHVPPYMIGVGPPPPYANVEPLLQQYYSQALQNPIICVETCLDEGLSLGKQFGNTFGTEFDINDLIWMNEAMKTASAQTAINAGMKPDEARKRYYALGKVPGGNAVYLQQQYFSLEALAKRDAADPFAKPEPAPPPIPDDEPADDEPVDMAASFGAALRRKALSAGLAASLLLAASVAHAQVTPKLAWDQPAATLAAANAQTYYALIGGNTVAPLVVTCTGTAAPFVCATPFPVVPAGNHSLTVNAVAGLLEAASSPFPFSAPGAPTNVRVTR